MGTEGRKFCRRQEQTGKVLADPVYDLKGTWCVQGLFVKQTLYSHSNVLRGNRNAGDSVSPRALFQFCSSSVETVGPASWRRGADQNCKPGKLNCGCCR